MRDRFGHIGLLAVKRGRIAAGLVRLCDIVTNVNLWAELVQRNGNIAPHPKKRLSNC
jgi:hypothetical protein